MTEDNTSIDEILTGEPPIEAPVEVEAPTEEAAEADAPEAEEATGPIRDEKGRFAPKGETAEAPPASPQEDEGPNVPRRALQDERSKRQALETELAQLRAQLAQPQPAQPQPQAEGPPDRWEDPEGYDRWLVNEAKSAAREEAIQAANFQRIQASAAQCRAEKPDFDEVVQVFAQMVASNPALDAQMQQAPNPAQFAYETAKLQQSINQHGSLQAYIDAQIAAKQNEALQSVQAQLPQSAPPTISADRSVGARSGPVWSGPVPLDDLLS